MVVPEEDEQEQEGKDGDGDDDVVVVGVQRRTLDQQDDCIVVGASARPRSNRPRRRVPDAAAQAEPAVVEVQQPEAASEPEESELAEGAKVEYDDRSAGRKVEAVVLRVHKSSVPPFYTIRLPDGGGMAARRSNFILRAMPAGAAAGAAAAGIRKRRGLTRKSKLRVPDMLLRLRAG